MPPCPSSLKSAPPRAATTRVSSWPSSAPSTSGSVPGGDFSSDVIHEAEGLRVLRVTGKGAEAVFENEPGGHRWQSIPPNDKKGRVHTSSITVVVLPEPREHEVVLADRDLDFKFCRGSGNGGQHKQKTDSACIVTHLPTGTQVRCETARSQHENKASAISMLRARLWDEKRRAAGSEREAERRRQAGSGQRGDKIRTIRVRDDLVTNHADGRTWSFKAYSRGRW